MFRFTDDLATIRVTEPVVSQHRVLISLPFYHSENVDIADETLSYAAPIDTTNLLPETAYAVRFFVFAKGRLHRSTEDTFFTPAQAPAPNDVALTQPRAAVDA